MVGGGLAQEHLNDFGLINLNARLYDPILERFTGMDPYVQMPDVAQSFNRYAYGLNNPLKYTDPDGEWFIIDSWIIGLFSGGWKEANNRAWNDIKIWGGLFVSDSNKENFGKQLWEIVSRFTWQLPQTLGGFSTAHAHNTFGIKGGVESVDYKYGATVLRTRAGGWGGVTLGSYIIGDNSIRADANNPLFQHEYGHYLQSQEMGWGYLPRVGIPSLMSANGDGNHKYQPFEQDANSRAFLYFNEYEKGFYTSETKFLQQHDNNSYFDGTSKGWNFYSNPLDVNHIGSGSRGQYYDYYNPEHRALVNSLSLSAKWYDYVGWLGGIPGALGVGIGNGLYYRNNRVR
jgi:RHS repeat-associated protein